MAVHEGDLCEPTSGIGKLRKEVEAKSENDSGFGDHVDLEERCCFLWILPSPL